MRAVLVGLVGVVLAVGGAEAASCPITRATLSTKDTGVRYGGVTQLERPDLTGKKFRVTRYVERKKLYYSKPRGSMYNIGYEAYEVRGGGGTFIVQRHHVDGTPSVTPLSYPDAKAKAPPAINWASAPRQKAPRVKVGEEVDYILTGPLSALTFEVAACH